MLTRTEKEPLRFMFYSIICTYINVFNLARVVGFMSKVFEGFGYPCQGPRVRPPAEVSGPRILRSVLAPSSKARSPLVASCSYLLAMPGAPSSVLAPRMGCLGLGPRSPSH